ncbi:DODA-type extradiol aromatic ring-opening family dioxygenase [Pseudomonas sp. NPDC078700]|uniref:DODA-type extradiol aromatic ring-opening family dioxygenase n=1 Tax=Pseudomonas sp. NPDC078700 TaxID=3364424 RepID=UPI0037C8E558
MLPSLYISHGSPMLALEPGSSGPALRKLAAEMETPKGIILMSAHWESDELRVSSAEQPSTWHDFGGFPAALYQVNYPAPGDPALASQVIALLNEQGLAAKADANRPFDHGTWVPLSLMYPQATIAVVQVSLPSQQGPAMQHRIGKALSQLRAQGYLLIGSGSITHNLRELDWQATHGNAQPWAQAFRDWIVNALRNDDTSALFNYRELAPFAARNHPSDEHLLPLFFAYGAGSDFSVAHSGFTLGALGMDIYRFD